MGVGEREFPAGGRTESLNTPRQGHASAMLRDFVLSSPLDFPGREGRLSLLKFRRAQHQAGKQAEVDLLHRIIEGCANDLRIGRFLIERGAR